MTQRQSTRFRRFAPYLALFALAFFLRVAMPGPINVTTDEPLWLLRSAQFSKAITHGDLANATAWGAVPGIDYPTMPGVPTMWAGTAARGVLDIGHAIGVTDPVPPNPLQSASLLRWSRVMVALMVAAGIAVFAWVAGSLLGRRAGLIAGVLCTVEPWFVGHSFVLHTDALVTIFGATSLTAMLAAWRNEPKRRVDHALPFLLDRKLLAVSAVSGGLTIATKLNGLAIVGGGIGVIVAWELARRWVRTPSDRRRLLLHAPLWLAGWFTLVVATVVIVWPALWVQPITAMKHLKLSLDHPAPVATQFFMGRATHDPGPIFYPVTLALRLSPWLLLGLIGVLSSAVVAAVARVTSKTSLVEHMPKVPFVLLVALLPYGVAMSDYTRKYDRYGLVFIPIFALLCAPFIDRFFCWTASRWNASLARGGALACVALLSLAVLLQAPFAISFVDPMLGGQPVAKKVMLLGWGEGAAGFGRRIARENAGRCDSIHIARPGGNLIRAEFPCGKHAEYDDLLVGDFLVLDVNQVQRNVTAEAITRKYGLQLHKLSAKDIGGVAYVTLYQVTATRTSR